MRSNKLINPRPKIMLNINPELLDELLKEYRTYALTEVDSSET